MPSAEFLIARLPNPLKTLRERIQDKVVRYEGRVAENQTWLTDDIFQRALDCFGDQRSPGRIRYLLLREGFVGFGLEEAETLLSNMRQTTRWRLSDNQDLLPEALNFAPDSVEREIFVDLILTFCLRPCVWAVGNKGLGKAVALLGWTRGMSGEYDDYENICLEVFEGLQKEGMIGLADTGKRKGAYLTTEIDSALSPSSA